MEIRPGAKLERGALYKARVESGGSLDLHSKRCVCRIGGPFDPRILLLKNVVLKTVIENIVRKFLGRKEEEVAMGL